MKKPFGWLRNGEFFDHYGLSYVKIDHYSAYCFDRDRIRTMSNESKVWLCECHLFNNATGVWFNP